MKNKKKVNITKKPERIKVHPIELVDDWVLAKSKDINIEQQQEYVEERTEKFSKSDKLQYKRFTLDLPVDLHKRIKVTCAERGLNMSDEIRKLLVQEFIKR
jgi:hypothetical protein